MHRTAILMCVATLAVGAPALAAGPVDGEFGALWWANDFDTQGVSTDAAAPGFRAELWLFEKYGVRATHFSSDLDSLTVAPTDSSDYTSFDLMWKAFSPTENNFLAVGLGWEEVDLTTVGMNGETSGARLSAEGRIGFAGAFYGYGQASYLPSLDDTPDIDPGFRFEGLEGMEYELGVAWKAAPFISVRAGYRANSVDFDRVDTVGTAVAGDVESKGFLLGVGAHF